MPARNEGSDYTLDQFVAVRRYQSALAFSPDGEAIAYATDASGQFNLWRQPAAGGEAVQLTHYEEHAVRDLGWSPDGRTILYSADHQGDESSQLYAIPAVGGPPTQLTTATGVRRYLATLDPWSPDGRWIAYAANDRDPADQDVLVHNVATGEIRRVLAGAYAFPMAWSPDGLWLTAIAVRTNTDIDVYLVSLGDGSARRLALHDGEAMSIPGPWTPDGTGFCLLTDAGRDFAGLARYRLGADAYEWLATPDWDVEHVAASPEGRILAWVVNEDGYSRLAVRDLTDSTGGLLRLPRLPDGVISRIRVSRDGERLGLLLNRPRHPTEVFVLDLIHGTLNQPTDGFLGDIAAVDLVSPAAIRYPTHDGRQVPALLYRPRGTTPFPVVLAIHGGPEAQERPVYSAFYQYLISRGIGVFAPNVRGSTGYGKTYQRLIHHDWGGDELKDFETAARYLRSLDWVDPARIGVFGSSYGGFAALSCVSRLPEYWAAAVEWVGPSNLATLIAAAPPDRRRLLTTVIGDPETEADFLRARSPLTYADQIRTPLFIVQGANDPRVVKAESDQIVARLRARGVEVRYDVYPDEGHVFAKRANELRAWRDTADFFERHLTERP